ncbi:MAG: hypothetical protein WC011_02915 [Candidatus Paceibacterota bacterium]
MENNENNTRDIGFHIKDTTLSFSYTKSHKLITALFMVTDIMDKQEGIRNKLRNIGLEIISDISTFSSRTDYISIGLLNKISQTLVLLDISSNVKLMSQMNADILKKEFYLFKKSVEDSLGNRNPYSDQVLSDLFKDEENTQNQNALQNPNREIKDRLESRPKMFEVKQEFSHADQRSHMERLKKSIRQAPTNIGLQKGSTLLKALKEIEAKTKTKAGDTNKNIPKVYDKNKENIKDNTSKQERRTEIVSVIKDNPNGLTITEVRSLSKGQFTTMSEKTLQRELVSLVKDNLLYKTGEKRWSRYFFKK